MRTTKIGFIVMESSEDYEQGLGLEHGKGLPDGGILNWSNTAFLFPGRKEARDAIQRTEHYRLAFRREDLPEKRFCRLKIVEKKVND